MKATLLFSFYMSTLTVCGQWMEKNEGLFGGQVNSLVAVGNNVYAGGEGGFFVSSDRGENWTAVRSELITSAVVSLLVIDNQVLVGTNANGLFRCTKNGSNWTVENTGLTRSITILSLAISGSNVFAGTSGGVFLSNDYGASWRTITPTFNFFTYSVVVSGGKLFAASPHGIISFTNTGTDWIPDGDVSLIGIITYSLVTKRNDIFAGTRQGVYKSADKGKTWTVLDSGLDKEPFYSMVIDENKIYAVGSRLYRSIDDGITWEILDHNIAGLIQFTASGGNFYANTVFGVYFSDDAGKNWTAVNSGLTTTRVFSFAVNGSYTFVGTGGGVFFSSNNGDSWTPINSGLDSYFIRSLAVNGNLLFAGTDAGVYVSNNNGINWKIALSSNYVKCLATQGNNIYAGTGSGMFRSIDNGVTWNRIFVTTPDLFVISIVAIKDYLYVATPEGVYRSIDKGNSWERAGLNDYFINDLAVSDSTVYAATNYGVFVTSIKNTFWHEINIGLTRPNINNVAYSIIVAEKEMYTITSTGVFHSKIDDPVWYSPNWSPISAGLPSVNINTLAVINKNLFAGTWGRGVWMLKNVTVDVDQEVPSISISPNPVDDFFQINGSVGTIDSYQIIDAQGKISLPIQLQKVNDMYQASVGNLSPGIYLLRIIKEGNPIQIKFLKK